MKISFSGVVDGRGLCDRQKFRFSLTPERRGLQLRNMQQIL